MILGAGIDPGTYKILDDMKPQVKQWLLSLDAAKECFEKTFEDPDLEKFLCSFVFNEPVLRKCLLS